MYRISNNKRKYSTTPIVKVVVDGKGKEKEVNVLYSPLTKKDGDKLLESVLKSLPQDDSKFFTFNLNNNIKVKLNDLGYERLAEHNNHYIKIHNQYHKDQSKLETADYNKLKADDNGYTDFLMWKFMNIFGEVTSQGLPEHFNMNILINNQ